MSVLTISLGEGEDFFVAEKRFEVVEVYMTDGFAVRMSGGKRVEITSERAEEIVPGVFLQDGHRNLVGHVRAVFQAPRDVVILRGKLYREAVA